MKRPAYLVITAQLIMSLALSQQPAKNAATHLGNLNCKMLSFEGTESKNTGTFPFSRIVVEDIRQDTTKLGFARDNLSGKLITYCAKGSFADEISKYVNKYFQKNFDNQSPDELLICVKKTWLSHFDTTGGKVQAPKNFPEFLYYKADVYMRRQEAYYPILRVDTIIAGSKKETASTVMHIQNAFLHTITSAGEMDINKITKRKARSREEINAYNKYPDLAIFQVNIPEKGVYCSFEEFKRNQPCYKEFLIRFESRVDIVYVKGTDGNLYAKRELWGLSDGKNVFIRMGDNLFPIYRRDNTWEFFGTFKFVKTNFEVPVIFRAGVVLAAASSAMQNVDEPRFKARDMRPYQVDMETGNFY